MSARRDHRRRIRRLGSSEETRERAGARDGDRPHELPPLQPLLYQVATAALSPADIAAPLRAVLTKHDNIEVMLAEVKAIDVNARIVSTGEREISYDYLIVATGSRHPYFGNDQWEKLAPGLKSFEERSRFVVGC